MCIIKISKPYLKKDGYTYVTAYYNDGTNKRQTYQRSLVEWFIGRKLLPQEIVILKDGNKQNLCISNLKLGNNQDRGRIGGDTAYQKSNKKSRIHPNLKLNYFKEINNKNKAYWLGVLYADGHIKSDSYTLSFVQSANDDDLLYKFCKEVGADSNKIYLTGGYDEYPAGDISRIVISNKIFIQHLISNGCVRCKSKLITFPNLSTYELNLAFIQGYFDGDGWNTTNNIGICSGSKQFLERMLEFFKHLTCSKIRQTNTYYTLTLNKQILKLLNDNYPQSKIRKRLGR